MLPRGVTDTRRASSASIAQLAEHALSKRKVTSSILVEGLIRYGVVGNISACHADARGAIPRFGVLSASLAVDYLLVY